MRHRNRSNAFTLIELLVVISIVVTLLAILLPSIGRALYASNVATCGSNLRQIGVGVFAYSGDHFTMYPHVPDPTPYSSVPTYEGVAYRPAFKPWLIASKSHIDGYFDLVSILEPYFGNNMGDVFVCPNIAPEWEAGSKGKFPWWHTNAGVTSYAMMFNTARSDTISKPMRRVGERWQQAISNATQVGTRGAYFDILLMDPASQSGNTSQMRGNHPTYGSEAGWVSIANGHGTGKLSNSTMNANYLTQGGGVENYDGIDYSDSQTWGGSKSFFLVPAAMAKSEAGSY